MFPNTTAKEPKHSSNIDVEIFICEEPKNLMPSTHSQNTMLGDVIFEKPAEEGDEKLQDEGHGLLRPPRAVC